MFTNRLLKKEMNLLNDAKRSPHKLIHGVVKIQITVRRWLALTYDCGNLSYYPLNTHVQVGLAVYLSRRLRNGIYMQTEYEMANVAKALCGGRTADLATLKDLQEYCLSHGMLGDAGFTLIRERLRSEIVGMQERLHLEIKNAGDDIRRIDELISEVKLLWPVTLHPYLSFAEKVLMRKEEDVEQTLETQLAKCVTVSDYNRVIEASHGRILSRSILRTRITQLIEQRRQTLRTSILTLFQHPLKDGIVPELEHSAKTYANELFTDDAALRRFAADICILIIEYRLHMESNFKIEDELSTQAWTTQVGVTYSVPLVAKNTTPSGLKIFVERLSKQLIETARTASTERERSIARSQHIRLFSLPECSSFASPFLPDDKEDFDIWQLLGPDFDISQLEPEPEPERHSAQERVPIEIDQAETRSFVNASKAQEPTPVSTEDAYKLFGIVPPRFRRIVSDTRFKVTRSL